MHQAELDAATLRCLIADLKSHVEVLEIVVKTGPGRVDDGAPAPRLHEVLDLLESGQVRGLQVRYRYNGEVWWDTLMPLAKGWCRLVRVRHEELDS